MGHGTLSAAKIEQAGRNQRRADTPDLMMLMHLVAGPPLHVTGQIPCICFRTCLLVCTWPGPHDLLYQSDCSVLFITMYQEHQ